jgi:hypothetical protein
MASCRIQWLYSAVHGCKTYLNLNLNRKCLADWRMSGGPSTEPGAPDSPFGYRFFIATVRDSCERPIIRWQLGALKARNFGMARV